MSSRQVVEATGTDAPPINSEQLLRQGRYESDSEDSLFCEETIREDSVGEQVLNRDVRHERTSDSNMSLNAEFMQVSADFSRISAEMEPAKNGEMDLSEEMLPVVSTTAQCMPS